MNDQRNAGRELIVVPDADALAEKAAQALVDRARQPASSDGMFRLALSGGNTPRRLYEKLAAGPYRDQVDWSRVHVFFSDERFVPPDSPESNYHLASETLLSKVPIPERFVHAVATVDVMPEESAALYEEGIRRVFQVALPDLPRFDLILLGMGPDGHTASLFPDTEALAVTDRLVAANFVSKLDTWRVTFTFPLINAARCVMFLIQGEDKAERVAQVVGGSADLPAGRVRPREGDLLWLLDEAAASRLPAEERQVGRPEASTGREA